MATAKQKLAAKEEKLKAKLKAELKEKKSKKKAGSKDKENGKGKGKQEEVEEEEEADDNMPKGKKKNGKNFVEVESDEARKLSYGKGLAAPMRIPGFSTDNVLDKIERKIGIGSTGMGAANENRMSTSMLMYDLILGGGITAGWYTNFGKEQSCKSTAAMTFTAAAISAGIPVITVFDFEGCLTEDSTIQISGTDILFSELIKEIALPNENEIQTIFVDSVGKNSVQAALHFGGLQTITKVKTESGRELKGYKHPVMVKTTEGPKWKYIEDIKPGVS